MTFSVTGYFREILNDVAYYKFATALAHFGHYEDAQYLLEDHLNSVETTEGYSNLGYVHLQRAREYMPEGMAYRYWFPTILELKNGFEEYERSRSILENEMPAKAMEHLKLAEQSFKKALEMDEEGLIGFVNLAAVYLYIPNKIHRAYAAIEDARGTKLGKAEGIRKQIEGIYQLIRVNDDVDSADRWAAARDSMSLIVETPNAPLNVVFNYARMLDDRGRTDSSIPHWEYLLENIVELPYPYRKQVCIRLRIGDCPDKSSLNFPYISDSIPIGIDTRYAEAQLYLSSKWKGKTIPEKVLHGLRSQVYLNEDGDSLLTLDNRIEMMILRNIPPDIKTLADLQLRFGMPHVSLPLGIRQLLSYNSGWSAVVEKDKVVEIWIDDLKGTR